MTYLPSRVAGTLIAALGLFIAFRSLALVDLRREELSPHLHTPVPAAARVPGGMAGLLLLGVPLTLFGLRLILKPKRLGDPV